MDEIVKISGGVLYANLLTAMFLYGAWHLRGLSMDEAGDKFVPLACLGLPLLTALGAFIFVS